MSALFPPEGPATEPKTPGIPTPGAGEVRLGERRGFSVLAMPTHPGIFHQSLTDFTSPAEIGTEAPDLSSLLFVPDAPNWLILRHCFL